nr:MAG TPA: hypothetical protein [Caudoviricetes sp.]
MILDIYTFFEVNFLSHLFVIFTCLLIDFYKSIYNNYFICF